MDGERSCRVHVASQLRLPTRIWYLFVQILWSYGERVNFGRELMGSTY